MNEMAVSGGDGGFGRVSGGFRKTVKAVASRAIDSRIRVLQGGKAVSIARATRRVLKKPDTAASLDADRPEPAAQSASSSSLAAPAWNRSDIGWSSATYSVSVVPAYSRNSRAMCDWSA